MVIVIDGEELKYTISLGITEGRTDDANHLEWLKRRIRRSTSRRNWDEIERLYFNFLQQVEFIDTQLAIFSGPMRVKSLFLLLAVALIDTGAV